MNRKPFKEFLQNDKGQILVMTAFVLVVLLGFLGLVVDIGFVYLEKQRLQDGVDASALGAAQVIIENKNDVEKVARELAEKNGLKGSKLDVKLNTSQNTVELNYSHESQLYFLSIFGADTIELRTSATAKAIQGSSLFDYVIFSGDRIQNLVISGNDQEVVGMVHINGNMELSGNNNNFKERLAVVGNFNNRGNNNNINQLIRRAPYIKIPEFDINHYRNNASRIHNGDMTFWGNNVEINGVVYVNGDVQISGNSMKGNGTIVATGSITIKGNNLEYLNKDDLIGFYSLRDINFSGNNATLEGVYYAPNGSINLLGNNVKVKGAVIAKQVNILGNGMEFIYDSRVRTMGSEKSIKLIK